MTTEVSLFKGGVPAHLKAQPLNAITKSLLGGGGGSKGKRISIRGGVFRLMVDGKEIAVNEDRSMNVVLINVAPKVSRTYYAGAYVENAKVSPTCWTADGDRPDDSAADPQSKACASCPQNIKGSGANNTRACKFNRMVAVVLENDIEGDMFQLSLPSQSIFGNAEDGKMPLSAYAQFLGGFNVNINAVITEMRFDTKSATPKLTFKAVRALTVDEFALCVARGETQEAKDLVTVSFSPVSESAAPAAVPRLAKPAVEEEDAPPAPEPKKRGAKEDAAPAAPKKDLAKMLDAWDDEE